MVAAFYEKLFIGGAWVSRPLQVPSMWFYRVLKSRCDKLIARNSVAAKQTNHLRLQH